MLIWVLFQPHLYHHHRIRNTYTRFPYIEIELLYLNSSMVDSEFHTRAETIKVTPKVIDIEIYGYTFFLQIFVNHNILNEIKGYNNWWIYDSFLSIGGQILELHTHHLTELLECLHKLFVFPIFCHCLFRVGFEQIDRLHVFWVCE